MSAEKEYQTELLCDQEYFTKAAEAAMFAYGSPISFEKLAEAIGARVEDIPKILNAMIPRYKDSAIEVLILGRAAHCSRNVCVHVHSKSAGIVPKLLLNFFRAVSILECVDRVAVPHIMEPGTFASDFFNGCLEMINNCIVL